MVLVMQLASAIAQGLGTHRETDCAVYRQAKRVRYTADKVWLKILTTMAQLRPCAECMCR